jgi:hypothetical protein
MLHGILSGAGWFAVFLAAHIAWFHAVHVVDAFKWIMKTLAVCVVAHAVTVTLLNFGSQSAVVTLLRIFYGFLAMGCLFILYMPFYYTIVASLSIQTLICLEESPRKSLTILELRERFASRDIVAGRLKIMARNGYLDATPSGYCVTPKARAMSGIFGFLKELWKLGPGG